MKTKFTRQQVRSETLAVHGGWDKTKSAVYQAWAELADEWMANDDGEYAANGFRGFMERSPNGILLDFNVNQRLSDPLTENESITLLDDKELS